MAEAGDRRDGKILTPDFGGEKVHKARRLRKLLDLDALHEANVRDNPLPYLERASERIFQLERALFEAHIAGGTEAPALGTTAGEAVMIDRASLDQLRACRDRVRQAYETLVRSSPNE